MGEQGQDKQQRIGPFEIRWLLGRGGMGEVWLAHDPMLDRRVAVKVLPPERMLDPQAEERLIKEARAASALDHPGIVRVHQLGRDAGRLFIAMEFIQGQLLSELIEQGAMAPAQTAEVIERVADALAAAHRAKLIHRDIKPDNIVLRDDGQPKILDFGLVHAAYRNRRDDPPPMSDTLALRLGLDANVTLDTHSRAPQSSGIPATPSSVPAMPSSIPATPSSVPTSSADSLALEQTLPAEAVSEASSFDTSSTQLLVSSAQTAAAGTPLYMAPEQIAGKEPSPAADQFALAATAYELLTGRTLRRGESLADVLTTPVVAVVRRDPQLPKPVRRVLCRALADTPGARFDSVLAFAGALKAALSTARETSWRDTNSSAQDGSNNTQPSATGDSAHSPTSNREAPSSARSDVAKSRQPTPSSGALQSSATSDPAPLTLKSPASDGLDAGATPADSSRAPITHRSTTASDSRPPPPAAMRISRRSMIALGAGAAVLLAFAAGALIQSRAEPSQVTMVLVPGNAALFNHLYTPVAEYFAERIDKKVHVHVARNYEEAIAGIVEGQFQLGFLPPRAYIEARQRQPELILLGGRSYSGRTPYRSYVVARAGADNPKPTLASLKGKTLCYVDAKSTSGHLAARMLLRQQGIEPKRHFGQLRFIGGHYRVLRALKRGECDAGAVSSLDYADAPRQAIVTDDLPVIAQSETLPPIAIVAHPSLRDATLDSLRAAVHDARETNPMRESARQVSDDPGRFMSVDDAAYDVIRAMMVESE